MFTARYQKGFFINRVSKHLKLCTRVDSFAVEDMGILVENENNITTVGFNNGSGRDDWDVDNLMAVNPLDIYSSTSCLEYTSVSTTYSAIGSAINEGAMFDAGVSVGVNNLVHIAGAVDAVSYTHLTLPTT